MKCKQCGTQILKGVRFCLECGACQIKQLMEVAVLVDSFSSHEIATLIVKEAKVTLIIKPDPMTYDVRVYVAGKKGVKEYVDIIQTVHRADMYEIFTQVPSEEHGYLTLIIEAPPTTRIIVEGNSGPIHIAHMGRTVAVEIYNVKLTTAHSTAHEIGKYANVGQKRETDKHSPD